MGNSFDHYLLSLSCGNGSQSMLEEIVFFLQVRGFFAFVDWSWSTPIMPHQSLHLCSFESTSKPQRQTKDAWFWREKAQVRHSQFHSSLCSVTRTMQAPKSVRLRDDLTSMVTQHPVSRRDHLYVEVDSNLHVSQGPKFQVTSH